MSSSTRRPASTEQSNGTTADRPWYREEHWLAVALASLVVAGLAFVVPVTLKLTILVVAGVLAAVAVVLLVWREIHLARHESPRHPSAHTEAIMPTRTTWLPLATSFDINDNGKLDPRERRSLPDSAFALPAQRELPLVDADHVRDAIAQLADRTWVSGEARELAAANIMAAAAHFGLELPDGSPNLVAR